jgi:hypothetical protein
MIGALLILLGLVIIFLTRPNNQRNQSIKKFTSNIKRHIFKQRNPISDRNTSASTLSNRFEDHILSEVRFTDDKAQEILSSADQTLKAYLDNIATDKSVSSSLDNLAETPSSGTTQANNHTFEELRIFPVDDTNHLRPDEIESVKNEVVAETLAELKVQAQNPETITEAISGPTEDQGTKRPSEIETSSLSDLNQKKVEILKMLKDSLLKVTFNTTETKMDNSIIDIDSKAEPIDYSDIKQTEKLEVPTWPHMYVYGYSDLEKASHAQREFYNKFKVKFLTGKWVDLAGNSNYAFILLFDLLKQFNVHKNINVLEEQMNKISIYYPKTSSYAKKNLIQKMREIDCKEGLDRLEWTTANNVVPDYQTWDWKNRSIKTLSLGKEDAKLLDDFYINQNNFVGIESCSLEIVKLYISARKALTAAYKFHNLTQKDQFAIVLDLVARKQYNFRMNSQNYKYVLEHNSQTIFGYLFKYCENKIRELYDYKKLNLVQSFHEEVLLSLTTNVASFIDEGINRQLEKVKKPNLETEQKLNSQVTTRWKVKLPLTMEYYQRVGKDAFLADVKITLEQNAKNPSLETIYYEVSKFLTPLDKQLAFEYFLRYTNQNLSAKTLVLKSMPQNIVKKLFSTPELHTRYHNVIIAQLKREITIDKALEEIKDFFLPQRKKIILNTQAIRQVEEQHSGTVEVLNEYLKDEESYEGAICSPSPTTEETFDTIIPTDNKEQPQPYNFNANQNEIALLSLFKEKNYIVSNDEADIFCKSIGANKSALINNLNENCYDVIDDLLIETDENNYTINQTYYQQILKV